MTGFRLERATFDPFVWRDGSGRVHFDGQRPTTGRHRERVWPALHVTNGTGTRRDGVRQGSPGRTARLRRGRAYRG